MKIAVVGTINRDTIELPDGRIECSYGGLLYSIITLALLTPPGTAILPLLNLGRDVERPVRTLLSRYQRVSQEGIRIVAEQNNHVILRYRSMDEREEIQLGGLPPVTFDQMAPFLDADVFLVNFISGRDLSLASFSRLRSSTQAAIYTDIHSLTLGIDERGHRYQRPLRQWQRWAAQTDVIQMNQAEARTLSGSPLDREAGVRRFGRAALQSGPAVLLITLGAGGSLLVTDSDGDLAAEHVAPYEPERIADTTGCGDVFMAAFLSRHALGEDPLTSSRFASRAAGIKAGLCGIEEMDRLAGLALGNQG
jgi:hypothetical protein